MWHYIYITSKQIWFFSTNPLYLVNWFISILFIFHIECKSANRLSQIWRWCCVKVSTKNPPKVFTNTLMGKNIPPHRMLLDISYSSRQSQEFYLDTSLQALVSGRRLGNKLFHWSYSAYLCHSHRINLRVWSGPRTKADTLPTVSQCSCMFIVTSCFAMSIVTSCFAMFM